MLGSHFRGRGVNEVLNIYRYYHLPQLTNDATEVL